MMARHSPLAILLSAAVTSCIGPTPTPTFGAKPRLTTQPHEWACEFPKEADEAKIDAAGVPIRLEIGPDGRPVRATILSDPGHGFGAATVECAMRQHYEPARDASGAAVRGTTDIVVRYEREPQKAGDP